MSEPHNAGEPGAELPPIDPSIPLDERKDGHAADIKGPVAWMARNGVAANTLMFMLVIGGVLALSNVRQEVFPEVELDTISVSVAYPGASPSEIEQSIILAVEEAVQGLDGVKEVRSASYEGNGLVLVELMLGADQDRALNDAKSAIDRITSFPQDAERPVVSLISNRTQAISLVLYGDIEEATLRSLAEDTRRDLLADPRVTYVEIGGTRELEISIEVPEAQLRQYGLTIDDIANRVRAASVELPAGTVRTTAGEILLRTTERRDRGAEFGDIAVMARPDGTQVLLRDIATIRDGFSEDEREVRFNGQRAVMVSAFRVGNETPLDVAAAVKEYAARAAGELPAGVSVTTWADLSEMYADRINLLRENALQGLVLVLLILGLLLEARLAFWVALGIPTSFAGSLIFFDVTDVSINMISLFAFIVTLGMVVDDAIVVGESVYDLREKGYSRADSAIKGVSTVGLPVLLSILTTCVAFLPMLFVPGVMGKFFRVLPIVVILVLVVSLVESLYVLPAHLSHKMPWLLEKLLWPILFPLQLLPTKTVSRGLVVVTQRFYLPTLKVALRWRYVTLMTGMAMMVASVGLIAGGRVGFSFLPKTAGDVITVMLKMPVGTPIADTRRALEQISGAAERLIAEHPTIAGGSISRGIYLDVGSNTSLEPDITGGAGVFGSNLGTVMFYMVAQEEREVTTSEIVRLWRAQVADIPGVDSLVFNYDVGAQPGSPVAIELVHEDSEVLEAAARRLAEEIRSYSSLRDIESGVAVGKEQLDFTLTAEGRALGLTEVDLARQVRAAYYGTEAVRQQRGRDEVRVFVRRPREDRSSLHEVEQMMVRAPSGVEIPLAQAAHVSRGRAYTVIRRTEGRQTITVTADVEDGDTNAGEIVERIVATEVAQLERDIPGLTHSLGGEQERQAETMNSLKMGFLFALFAMYALLAVGFKSYAQPILVLLAIPFGFIGAVWGHVLMGYDLSIMSQMGIVALAGVVVNDSLILVEATNEFRAEGHDIWRACLMGGARRIRPILLTSLTTFFGLAPIILETSVQARFLIPMAISLGFGVLFATFITLLLVPAAYMALEDATRGMGNFMRWLSGDEPVDEPEEPEGPADTLISDPGLGSQPAE
ncbi:MAG: efflux RND transporter permease subunit [Sandaracinaceae bacterium]|nr:efflux RND transporter permease subunit [Sandaracinaceae bacterium]